MKIFPHLDYFSRDLYWNLFCTASLIGIWPRFIEPFLIFTTYLNLKIPNLPSGLKGFKILQFSDLHFNASTSDRFVKKFIEKIRRLEPDMIAFTGDILCYGKMEQADRLKRVLQSLNAPQGCFAVLGNHDYAACVSVNSEGDYDIVKPAFSPLKTALSRFRKSVLLTGKITEQAKKTEQHLQLLSLLKETPFQLLNNATLTLSINDAKLNVCGLGEYMAGQSLPAEAFSNYDHRQPGIVLLHNPDGLPLLENYPGNIVLCGHTHGGQVNLPWIWKKFTLLENMSFKKGLLHIYDKWVYINRGIGSVIPFRWFSPPELLLLTLEGV